MLNLQIGYVSEHQHLNAVREDLSKATLVGVDTETTNLDPLVAKIRLLQISTGEKTWVLDCFKLPKQAVKEQILEPLLTNPKIVKVAQNWRFDAKMIETNFGWGLAETTSIFDTMIAAKLIDGGQYLKAGLDDLASKYLGVALDKSYQRYFWAGELYKEPIAYAGLDAAILLPLYRLLSKSLVENKLQKVAKLEFECIPALAQLELNGILIDKDLWLDIAEKGKEEMYQHELLLRQYFGDINLGSTQQICAALSEMTGMDIKSSAKQALIDLLKGYYEKPDLFGRVLDYRIPVMRLQEFNKIRKRQTSFGVDYLKRIHPKTGRIHSEFTQIETNTGRLSGREPNLMQIPRDSYMRAGFVAAEGNVMWCCVTGDSRVATDNGLKRIDQIDPISDRAVMPDGKFERIDRLLNQGFRQCREVVLSNGDRIIGSIDHRLLTVDTCGNRRWKAIEEIEVGDYLAVSHGQGISSNAVVEINSKEEQEVFDLTVSATGLYIANGFINHNCDYAAIEPRITAQLSKDELYCRIFNERLDAHVANAAAIFHVGMDKVTPEQRTKAKTIGLGVTYGLQASGYAARMDIPIHIAEREVAAFYDSHPGIGAWQKEQERYYRQYNCVRSASGRVRALPHWRYNEYEARSASKNFPIQATSSDITKLAITRMYRELPSDIKLVNVIHDEILAELKESDVAEYGPEIDRIMRESAQEFLPDVPIIVEGKAGKCWAK